MRSVTRGPWLSQVILGNNLLHSSVEPFDLFRYLDEQRFRYNERKLTDAERFALVLGSIMGKRLTWNTLTCQEAG